MNSGGVYKRRGPDRYESLKKPLLELSSDEESSKNRDKIIRRSESRAWHDIFTGLLSQWAEWFASILLGTGVFVGSFGNNLLRLIPLPRPSGLPSAPPPIQLTPTQEARLKALRARVNVPFDSTRIDHQDALKSLWLMAYPQKEWPGPVSELWKDMGWQGVDPSTDFRGGGFISLENLLYFGRTYPKSFQRLLLKEDGKRSEWEYPFAVGGLNVTFLLIQFLDLRADIPSTAAGRQFLKLLEENEMAFDELYCVAFEMLDVQWLSMGASYMEFNAVLKITRNNLERSLMLKDVHRIEDLPEAALLHRL